MLEIGPPSPMVELLVRLEWAGDYATKEPICPICGGHGGYRTPPNGTHKSNCELADILEKLERLGDL